MRLRLRNTVNECSGLLSLIENGLAATIRPEQHPPPNSVRRRLLYVVDHHDVRVGLGVLQLQAQLLL